MKNNSKITEFQYKRFITVWFDFITMKKWFKMWIASSYWCGLIDLFTCWPFIKTMTFHLLSITFGQFWECGFAVSDLTYCLIAKWIGFGSGETICINMKWPKILNEIMIAFHWIENCQASCIEICGAYCHIRLVSFFICIFIPFNDLYVTTVYRKYPNRNYD